MIDLRMKLIKCILNDNGTANTSDPDLPIS